MLFKYTLVLLVCITLIDTSDAWLFRRRNKQKLVYWDGDKKYKVVVVNGAGSAAKPAKELGCEGIMGCGKIADVPGGKGKPVELPPQAGGSAGMRDADGTTGEVGETAGGSADMRDAMAAAGAT